MNRFQRLRILALAGAMALWPLTPSALAEEDAAAPGGDAAAAVPAGAAEPAVDSMGAAAEPAADSTDAAASPSSAALLSAPSTKSGDAGPAESVQDADPAARRALARILGQVSRTEAEPRRMSLAEAVHAAVENNPGIRSKAELPRREAWEPFGATGAFDPKLNIDAVGEKTKVPSGSALASGLQTFEEDAVRTGVSISKLLRTGATVSLDWESQIVDTNSVFYRINPRYDNRLGITLNQPLLRNFWASDENTTVLVARSEAAESLAGFEAELADFVAGVVEAYWRYVEAAAELEVSRRSVALAEELVRDADARVAVGLLAKVAVKEAAADAAARTERNIVAENALEIARRDLQHEVMLGAARDGAPEPVEPVEEHVVVPVELDRVASLEVAVDSRAEIRRDTHALGRTQLEEKRARNLLLPTLDLVAQYGFVGLTGDARPVVDPDTGEVEFSPYDGDYGDSLDQMINDDFSRYSVGLQFEIPFANAAARAELAQAGIDVRRAARDLEQTVSMVALEVERAIADVESAAKRVVASGAARELAEENMRNQTRRFELGAVTTKDVLDFQEKLAEAQASEVRAITDHALSLTRLRVADGTLLTRFGIQLESPDAPGQPWWHKF